MEDSTVEIRPTEDKGRGLFALSHFNVGDTIFQEIPIVSCQYAWNEDYEYKACEYCMRALETAEENAKRLAMQNAVTLPHPEMCNVDKSKHVVCELCSVCYCSIECRQTAWEKYHMTLCLRTLARDKSLPLEKLKETWKSMHYPPETATIMLCAKMMATIKQAPNRDGATNILEQLFCKTPTTHNDEDYILKLLGVKSMDSIHLLMSAFFTAVDMEGCEQWASPEGFMKLVSIMAMNGQGIGTSSLDDWNTNVSSATEQDSAVDNFIAELYEQLETTVGDFLYNEGTGLYALQSACNHSCLPNAKIVFPQGNHQLALQAATTIEPGDEIYISYLDECGLSRSRHSRHKILSGNYQFTCRCVKCESEADEPDVTSEEDDDDNDDD